MSHLWTVLHKTTAPQAQAKYSKDTESQYRICGILTVDCLSQNYTRNQKQIDRTQGHLCV